MSEADKPWFVPDTQGFLAIAIIALMFTIVVILLLAPPQIDERTSGVLMTIVGVLIACLKDVYSFFFGSSKGSIDKDKTLTEIALMPSTGSANGDMEVRTTVPAKPGTIPTITTVTKESGVSTTASAIPTEQKKPGG